MFSSTLLFIALAIYGGIRFGYEPYLASQLERLSDEIQNLNQRIPQENQNDLFKFYGQLAHLNTVLDNHTLLSRLFDWLETHTYETVSFNKFQYERQTNELVLSGVGRSVNDVVVQLLEFQRQPEVREVTFEHLDARANSTWEFDAKITLAPEFLVEESVPAEPAGESMTEPTDETTPHVEGGAPPEEAPVTPEEPQLP
jgi:hypothetical protein